MKQLIRPPAVLVACAVLALPRFLILRLYSPLEPFFTKEWRPSEIEVVK